MVTVIEIRQTDITADIFACWLPSLKIFSIGDYESIQTKLCGNFHLKLCLFICVYGGRGDEGTDGKYWWKILLFL